MNFRFYEHFSCWTPLPAAQAWETIKQAIVQDEDPWHRKQGFHGAFDYREKVFHLRNFRKLWLYRQQYIPDIRLELLPRENGCDVDVEIRFGMFPLLSLLIPATILIGFFSMGFFEEDVFFPQYLKLLWLILVSVSLLLLPFQMASEVSASRNAIIELLNARDEKQLERRKRPKAQPVMQPKKVQSSTHTTPAFRPPKGHYHLQMLCPMTLTDTTECLNRALRYPASGFTGIRENIGWRLTTTEGKFGLRSSVYIELFEHPEGCYVAGTVRHHPLMLGLIALIGSPTAIITLISVGISIMSGSIFGLMMSFVFLTPSLIVWGAGAAMLMKSEEHLCSAVRMYLENN